jgi:hypothetical protein
MPSGQNPASLRGDPLLAKYVRAVGNRRSPGHQRLLASPSDGLCRTLLWSGFRLGQGLLAFAAYVAHPRRPAPPNDSHHAPAGSAFLARFLARFYGVCRTCRLPVTCAPVEATSAKATPGVLNRRIARLECHRVRGIVLVHKQDHTCGERRHECRARTDSNPNLLIRRDLRLRSLSAQTLLTCWSAARRCAMTGGVERCCKAKMRPAGATHHRQAGRELTVNSRLTLNSWSDYRLHQEELVSPVPF